jgi:hypothetical protein
MSKAKQNGKAAPDTITAVSVQGFKSIDKKLDLPIRPLTILAGVNSSGKSSVMQPLLLMKQTLESPSDPGPLLLNGPNVKFTQVEQMVHRVQRSEGALQFSFGLNVAGAGQCEVFFRKTKSKSLTIEKMDFSFGSRNGSLCVGAYATDDSRFIISDQIDPISVLKGEFKNNTAIEVVRNRCFLAVDIVIGSDGVGRLPLWTYSYHISKYTKLLTRIIHLPGLRGNPQRAYSVTAVEDRFPGTFDDYTASVIAAAQERGDEDFLNQLGTDLSALGLTWKVKATSVDDTRVELLVGRLPQPKRGGAHDLVSIADVGFGVSQTLPVVVALLTAQAGQLVYIEQPEIHLHPRAQHAMAELLVRAANRGVRVVAETHSSILLLGVQKLVATGALDPKNSILHWFARNEIGESVVTTRELKPTGAFGDWPADFDTVTLEAQKEYLDAAAEKLLKP